MNHYSSLPDALAFSTPAGVKAEQLLQSLRVGDSADTNSCSFFFGQCDFAVF